MFLIPGIFQIINFYPTNDSGGSMAIIMSYWVIIRHECSHNVAFLGRKHFPMTISPPGWKILIRQLPSDHLFYCNFLRRIRFRSSLAHRNTPWGVKSAFLGRKPHFQGWKNQFFAIFHPGDMSDHQFDPGIGFYAQNYMGNKSDFKFLLLKIFLKSQKWHQNSNLWIPFNFFTWT